MTKERFIELLTKELCTQLLENEREDLSLLLRDNPSYRIERELFIEYWQKEKGEYETGSALFKQVLEKIRMQESPREKGRPWIRYAAAAVVLATISLVIFYGLKPKRPAVENAVASRWIRKNTRAAQKDVLTLSDGSLVTLNSATTLRFPERFTDSIREVYLEGEAYFDVRKDAAHPFIIHAGKMNIRVLGTSFNVKSYKNESVGEATLILGSIEVTMSDRPADRIILKPKEKLIVQNLAAKKTVTPSSPAQDSTGRNTRYSLTNLTYFPNNVKTVVETSWVENKLVFSGKDFIDLSGQLERWYGVHIEFKSERVKHYNFTGMFEKETLQEALDALKMIDPFKYEIADSTVYIY